MADSFIPDSFTPDKGPAKAEHEKPIGPQRREFKPSRTALDVILNPQGAVEQAVSLPASMALTGGAGAAASKILPTIKYAPALARSLSEGAQRFAGSAIQGEDLSSMLKKGGLGTVTAGATEGLMGLAGKVASRLGGTARIRELQTLAAERGAAAFERAKQLPQEAFDAIKNRLSGRQLFGGGVTLPLSSITISVPSLSKARLTLDDAVQRLSKTMSPTWEVAVDEISSALNKLDKSKAAQKAGDLFKSMLPKNVQPPPPAPKALLPNTNMARTVADVITGDPIEGTGIPVGAAAAMPALSGKMPHLPIGTLLRGH